MKQSFVGKNPRIVCAANMAGGLIIPSARHFDDTMHGVIQMIWQDKELRQRVCGQMEQGFIDQYGKFYTRQQAWLVAEANGQINHERNTVHGILYSEGLY